MSCLYCGGDNCGGSGGGPTMCNDHPDNRVTPSRPTSRRGPLPSGYSQTRGGDGRLNTWDENDRLVSSEDDD
jgi:hypothetical protein